MGAAKFLTGKEAKTIGLVDEVASDGSWLGNGNVLCTKTIRICNCFPDSIKRNFTCWSNKELEMILEKEAVTQSATLRKSEDHKEGIQHS